MIRLTLLGIALVAASCSRERVIYVEVPAKVDAPDKSSSAGALPTVTSRSLPTADASLEDDAAEPSPTDAGIVSGSVGVAGASEMTRRPEAGSMDSVAFDASQPSESPTSAGASGAPTTTPESAGTGGMGHAGATAGIEAGAPSPDEPDAGSAVEPTPAGASSQPDVPTRDSLPDVPASLVRCQLDGGPVITCDDARASWPQDAGLWWLVDSMAYNCSIPWLDVDQALAPCPTGAQCFAGVFEDYKQGTCL